jgi:hypothetical protein
MGLPNPLWWGGWYRAERWRVGQHVVQLRERASWTVTVKLEVIGLLVSPGVLTETQLGFRGRGPRDMRSP